MNRVLRARSKTAALAAGVLTLGSVVFLADPATAGRIDAPQDAIAEPQDALDAPEDPPGHNGDIKITAVDDDSEPPENNPMQGCTLSVEWYNFDLGDLTSHLTFEAIAPTADAVLEVEGLLDVQVGEDPAGGGTDRDAREDYTFTTIGEPGPQGFHVKLEVHTPGVQGPEKKSKVFWIGDCSVDEPPVDEPPVDEPPVDEPPVDEPPVDEPPAGEPIVDPPVDNPADPSTDETVVSSPAGDEAEVPLVIDAGAQASTSSGQGGAGSAPGLALFGALLALGGYLLTRSRKTGGAHRR
jgi:hypothetical protein